MPVLAAQQNASSGRANGGATLEPTRSSGSVAERTCVGCRATESKESLTRVVRGPSGEIVPDPMRRLPGRGAHVHLQADCLAKAARGGLARAFRAPVELDAAALAEAFEERFVARRTGLLVAARRAGALAVGTDATREAIAGRKVALLLVASDAAGRRDELAAAVERLGRACLEVGSKVELGALLGRDEVGVVAVLDRGIADAMVAVSTDIAAAAAAKSALHRTRALSHPVRVPAEGAGAGSAPVPGGLRTASSGRASRSGGRTPR